MAAARELRGHNGAQRLLAAAAEAKHHADVHRPPVAGVCIGLPALYPWSSASGVLDVLKSWPVSSPLLLTPSLVPTAGDGRRLALEHRCVVRLFVVLQPAERMLATTDTGDIYIFDQARESPRVPQSLFVCGCSGLCSFFRCSVGLLWPLCPLLAGRSRARQHRLLISFCGEQGELVSTISGLWNGTRPLLLTYCCGSVYTRVPVPARAIGASH